MIPTTLLSKMVISLHHVISWSLHTNLDPADFIPQKLVIMICQQFDLLKQIGRKRQRRQSNFIQNVWPVNEIASRRQNAIRNDKAKDFEIRLRRIL